MKVYLRTKTRKTTRPKNPVMGITTQQYMNMIDWKNKGYIANDKILPHTQKEYMKIKLEIVMALKEKNIIQ